MCTYTFCGPHCPHPTDTDDKSPSHHPTVVINNYHGYPAHPPADIPPTAPLDVSPTGPRRQMPGWFLPALAVIAIAFAVVVLSAGAIKIVDMMFDSDNGADQQTEITALTTQVATLETDLENAENKLDDATYPYGCSLGLGLDDGFNANVKWNCDGTKIYDKGVNEGRARYLRAVCTRSQGELDGFFDVQRPRCNSISKYNSGLRTGSNELLELILGN